MDHNENTMPIHRDRPLTLKGEGISPGLAHGRAFLYTDILTRDLQIYNIKKKDAKEEMGRIQAAMNQVLDDLDEQKKIVQNQSQPFDAAIFDFHKQILKDKKLNVDLAEELQSELINAEIVVKNIFRKLAKKLRSSSNETIQAKADDLDDLSKKILRVLVGYESNVLEVLPPDSVIVARRLLPSDTVHMKRENLKGVVVEEGSAHSHSALLARAFGITAVANVAHACDQIRNGDDLLLDGERGKVIVHPTQAQVHEYSKRQKIYQSKKCALSQKPHEPVQTRCGQDVKIYANAYAEKDFRMAHRQGCDGIGLFRMENLYMASKRLLCENDIYQQLEQTFRHFPDKPITVRLLDVGGDKHLPYLGIKNERNSFLGIRGVRFLLSHKGILRTQIRAVLRLSEIYSIRLLVPMVTLYNEIKAVQQIMDECREDFLDKENIRFPDIPLGVMIETPAAVFTAPTLADHVDFFSIGTNDLLQYVMVAGRENMAVREYYEQGHAIILDIIANMVNVGSQKKIEVNVCGEMAGDLTCTKNLLSAGVRCFSVSPFMVPELKNKIKTISLVKG
jgi:phosphotransferase system enzyme I (PtsI)